MGAQIRQLSADASPDMCHPHDGPVYGLLVAHMLGQEGGDLLALQRWITNQVPPTSLGQC
jgi:hypothetical protein